MLLRLSPDAPEPIYQQLIRQIQAAISSGRLQPGAQLPSHRELATELVINHLTVKRAYEELDRSGLIVTKRGLGTYVADPLPKSLTGDARSVVENDVSRAATAARELGIIKEEWLKIADKAWKENKS
jgi:GntR family transcriptional regulator